MSRRRNVPERGVLGQFGSGVHTGSLEDTGGAADLWISELLQLS